MIYANVELTVEDRKTVANKNIVLYRGDRNVEIRFVIKGNRFTILDSTYAQMIIRRPSTTSVFSDPAPIQNDTVVFTISEDMIDELKEIGAYTFQVRLYDNSMNARATLPPCEGCLIINQPIAVEGEALVNVAMINDSAVLAAAYSDVPEDETFDNDNTYNRTVWADGDIITDVRMNKIEDAIWYNTSYILQLEDAIDSVDLTEYLQIETSPNEPTDEDVVIWIDTSEDMQLNEVARINDNTVASNTTWSSEKIDNTLDRYATADFVTSEIAKAQLNGGEVNLDGYATKDYVDDAIKDVDVTSQLQDYAKKTELHTHTNKTVLDGITNNKITEWDNKSTFDGNYNSLTNKPTIPSLNGYATEEFVQTAIDNAQLSGDSGTVDMTNYALKTELPTKTSQLTNDSGFITSIPSEYVTDSELNAKGYLTEHQDISNLALKSELHNHNNKSLLDAITSGDITKWSQSIPFSDTYTSDCNAWLTNGYIKTDANQTSNLPSVCTGSDGWGILFFIAENASQGTGTQMYFPIDGTYKGRVFVRSLTNMKASGSSVGAWTLLSTFSGDYNDLTNKPTINIVKMTESQYNALTTKDSNTLYIII